MAPLQRARAYGFKLASLNQLSRSRTVDNSATLMEYLYEFISKNERYKNSLDFVEDLQILDEATCVDITVLKQNINMIGSRLRQIKKRIDSFNEKQLITRMGDNFYKVMKPFHMVAVQKFDNLQKLREKVFADLTQLGVWLNEPKDINFKYLKTLNEFRMSFVHSIKTYNERKRKLAEIEKRKKWKQNSRVSRKKKRSSGIKKKHIQVVVNETDAHNDSKAQDGDKSNKHKAEKAANQSLTPQTDENDEKKAGNDLVVLTDADMDMDEQEKLFEQHNRASVRMRKEKQSNAKTHNDRDQNISDFVIKNLVAGSSRSLYERLQNRARSIQKKTPKKERKFD